MATLTSVFCVLTIQALVFINAQENCTFEQKFKDLQSTDSQFSAVRYLQTFALSESMSLLGSYGNKNYYLSKEPPRDFDEIQYICKFYGGMLLEINDSGEDNAIKEFLVPLRKISNHWVAVGGTDRASDGAWVFPSTNTPLTFVDWMPNEPKADPILNCLWLSYDKAQMYAAYCHYDRPLKEWYYICEVPQ